MAILSAPNGLYTVDAKGTRSFFLKTKNVKNELAVGFRLDTDGKWRKYEYDLDFPCKPINLNDVKEV